MANRAILMGRIGKDPEKVNFQNGGAIAKFSLATSERWKDKNTGERREKVEWHNVVVHGDGLINLVMQYLKKGSMIYLEGKIETRNWEKDGVKHYTTEIIVPVYGGKIEFAGGKNDSQGQATSAQPAQTGQTAQTQATNNGDDIPF